MRAHVSRLRQSSTNLLSRPLIPIGFMILFWALFDAITTFITPLLMVEHGLTTTQVGIIISSSSVFGAGFDLLLSKYVRRPHFRKFYLLMFIVCAFYLVWLYQASTIGMFLLAMAAWGFYYDLANFGTFDFVSRTAHTNAQAESFGILDMFKAAGYLIGPIVVAVVTAPHVGDWAFLYATSFLAIAFCVFWFFSYKKSALFPEHTKVKAKSVGILEEFHRWSHILVKLFPILFLLTLLYTSDAFFWTIGPFMTEELLQLFSMGYLFLPLYMLPALLVGLFVHKITKKWGHYTTAFGGALGGFCIFALFAYVEIPILQLLLVFCGASMLATSFPATRGMISEYIKKHTSFESEIEGVTDMFVNLGFIIGPATAGILTTVFGTRGVFALLGIWGVVAVSVLFLFSLKHHRIS